jgi:hypothetical protein
MIINSFIYGASIVANPSNFEFTWIAQSDTTTVTAVPSPGNWSVTSTVYTVGAGGWLTPTKIPPAPSSTLEIDVLVNNTGSLRRAEVTVTNSDDTSKEFVIYVSQAEEPI